MTGWQKTKCMKGLFKKHNTKSENAKNINQQKYYNLLSQFSKDSSFLVSSSKEKGMCLDIPGACLTDWIADFQFE